MRVFYFLLLLIGLATNAVCQKIDSAFTKSYRWLSKNNVSLRKTFDGSAKDEGKPAFFGWNQDYENNSEFVTVDAGLKISEFPFLKKWSSVQLLYPKLEWHKDGTPGKEKNNLAGGVNFEFFPYQAAKGPALWSTASTEYKYDFVKDENNVNLKGYLSLKGNANYLPGANTRDRSNQFFLRYYPYSGVEYYTINRLENGEMKKLESTMWASRLFIEYYPIRSFKKQYFQLTFDYSYRFIIADNLFKKPDPYYLTVGANFYPDGIGKFGFGFDYSVGDDPTGNFIKVQKLTLSIKIKL